MTSTRLSERQDFRSLVDHLEGVAVWVVSKPGEFDYISSGFEDIWGIPPEEIEADVSRLYETIHPDDRERVRSEIEGSGERVSEASYEGRVVRPDGTVRWVHTRHFPVRNGDGDVSIVGINTDITEQKRREEELAALNRVVRHDIRNDMSVVLGWTELLEDHVDDEGAEYVEKILAAGEHIVELTKVAREYAEVITEGETLEPKPTPLHPALLNELDRRRENFPDAEFVVGDVPDVAVLANELLPSVFRNLLNNAVQHNDKQTPTVEVACDVDDETVSVRVSDNGPGIPDDRKASIFERSERGIESSGSGIGLFLVQTLVEQYGGSVRVEDGDPTGSTFVVEFRRVA